MSNNLRDIRLFVAAYEENSFTAAAARENATQSGVSQHIRNLEDRLGVKLFIRDKGQIRPTPAGDHFYHRSVEVLRAHALATRSVKEFSHGLVGELVVGLMPTVTRCALAPALARFIEAHPNVSVRVIEAFSAVLTKQVQAGELDFAIVPALERTPGLRSRLLVRTPEILVSSRSSGLVHGAPVRLAELPPLKLAAPGRINTRRLTQEAYFASNRVRVDRILEMDAMFGILDFVSRTDWMTILPAILMTDVHESTQFTLNPIRDPDLWLDLVLIEPARRPLSEAAEAFLTILEQEILDLDRRWRCAPDTAESSRELDDDDAA